MDFTTRRNAALSSSEPGTPVYEGMVVGQSPRRTRILHVNVCKRKHLTNDPLDRRGRSAPPDTAAHHAALKRRIEFIAEDELIEVTPKSIRLRKRTLSTEQRLKDQAKKKKGL